MYRDFPFDQFIIITEFFHLNISNLFSSASFNKELTCTYLWLVQYYERYQNYYLKFEEFAKDFLSHIQLILNSKAFKTISKCEFEKRIRLQIELSSEGYLRSK